MKRLIPWLAAAGALAFVALPALAQHKHVNTQTGATPAISPQEHAFGKQGSATQVWRTITVEMTDAMRFTPSDIRIQQGETVRFIVKNAGALKHEIVLGTLAQLKEHGKAMQQHADMAHNAPYMAHVAPGHSQELIWHFTKVGQFHFGCLSPGHLEAGMLGKITVSPAK